MVIVLLLQCRKWLLFLPLCGCSFGVEVNVIGWLDDDNLFDGIVV